MALRGRCRLCGTGRDLSRHHLIPRRMRLEAVPAATIGDVRNIYLCCVPCHVSIEMGEYRRDVRQSLSKTEVRFLVSAVGREWIDREYPMPRPLPASIQAALRVRAS